MEGCAESVNIFNSDLLPSFSNHQNSFSWIGDGDYGGVNNPLVINSHDQPHDSFILDPHMPCENLNFAANVPSPYLGVNVDGEIDEASADCLKFISEILMEQELDDQIASSHDYTALQATEKSLYDALGETFPSSSDEYPSSLGQNTDSPDDYFQQSSISLPYGMYENFSEIPKELADCPANTLLNSEFNNETTNFDWFEMASLYASNGVCDCSNLSSSSLMNQGRVENNHKNNTVDGTKKEGNGSKGRKNLTRDEADYEQGRRNKHLATDTEDYVQIEQYDDVILCKEDSKGNVCCDCKGGSSDDGESGNPKSSKGKKTRRKRRSQEGEVFDLVTLLTQCAQAVASSDLRNANELLNKIRLHSSQYGDSMQRVAHYFANALEARLLGKGWQQYKNFTQKQNLTTSQVLKAYREYVSAIPFKRESYFVANDTITKLAEKATKIHVIDFGISYGFQWPGLIQMLSKRTVGPPVLRITGIDYPERGFRPAKKVEEAGRRLAEYCERFKVPFRYQTISNHWEDVTLEDINIEKDELVVVNCLFMSRKLADEIVEENNPRDSFFNFIRKLNPNLFIQGIVNGSYGVPFFMTRFKKALFHYTSIFDMFEATIPRESEERRLVESYLHGEQILNVLACEGTERIERPETYRQWQVRIQRAGFRKLPLDYELVERLKANVMTHHKDFVVDTDSHWMLQGWKGRILYAISCWRAA